MLREYITAKHFDYKQTELPVLRPGLGAFLQLVPPPCLVIPVRTRSFPSEQNRTQCRSAASPYAQLWGAAFMRFSSFSVTVLWFTRY